MKRYVYKIVDTGAFLTLEEPVETEEPVEPGDEIELADGTVLEFLGVIEATNDLELIEKLHKLAS